MGTYSLEKKLIFNILLDFIFRVNKAGNESNDIVSKSAQYYKPDMLLKAKEIL